MLLTQTTIAGEMLLISVECPEIRCLESNNFTAQNAQKKPVRLALHTTEIETKSMPKTHRKQTGSRSTGAPMMLVSEPRCRAGGEGDG